VIDEPSKLRMKFIYSPNNVHVHPRKSYFILRVCSN
jgi:hypothetical protein